MRHLDEMLSARGVWNPDQFLKILNSSTKKSLPEDRKPKHLNSDLAQKIKSLGRIYYEVYQRCSEDPKLLSQLEKLAKPEILKYRAMLDSVLREKDPAEQKEQLSRYLTQLKKTLLTYLGIADAKAEHPESRLQEAVKYGQRYWGR